MCLIRGLREEETTEAAGKGSSQGRLLSTIALHLVSLSTSDRKVGQSSVCSGRKQI